MNHGISVIFGAQYCIDCVKKRGQFEVLRRRFSSNSNHCNLICGAVCRREIRQKCKLQYCYAFLENTKNKNTVGKTKWSLWVAESGVGIKLPATDAAKMAEKKVGVTGFGGTSNKINGQWKDLHF